MDDDDIVFQILSGNDEEPKEEVESDNIKQDENDTLSKVDQEVKEQQEKENNLKKKLEEERKAEDSFIPNYQNPLDYINYFEIEKTNQKISQAYSNFLILDHRKKSKLKSVLEIEPHLDINKAIFTEKNRYIKCIYPKDDDLILCDSKGNIIFFSLKEKKKTKEIPFPTKFLSTAEPDDNERIINCLDITDEHDVLFVGYLTGIIRVFDLKKNLCKYTINKIHNNISCTELRYSHREKNVFHILSCDIDGNVSYSILKDGTLGWRLVSTDKLIENRDIPISVLKFIRPCEYINSLPKIKDLHQTAIFGAIDSIYLYSLEPEINEIAQIDKPDYVKENVIPDIQIGIGRSLINSKFTKEDDKNRLIMAVSWGRVITFYDLFIKDTFITQPIILGNYVNDVNILKIGFLGNSVLYLIDEKYTIKILNTRKINYGRVEIVPVRKTIRVNKNNSDSELQNESLLDKNILNQKKITDPENSNKEIGIYQYTIVENNSSLFILCKNALYFGGLVDWKEFLNKLSKKEEHLSLFSIGIDIYQGKMNALLNIPFEEENRKKLLGDFLRGEITKFVIFTTGSKKSGTFDSPEEVELIKKCMNISIELCLEIESFDYLITKIEPMFESIEYGEYFLTKLEPFILYDKIKNIIISEDIVKEIIDLYKRKDMTDVLSQLLLHVNIKSIDNEKIKEQIKSLNLISPLINLYMNGSTEDYFAPVSLMFQHFTMANELNDFTNYHDALELNSVKTVLNSKQYYGHKILWYFRLCLTGRKFPNSEELMKKDLFNALIPDITYWLMTEKVMNSFLEFDPKYYFNILKNIFSLKLYHEKLLETAKNSDKKIAVTAQLLNEKSSISDIEPLTLIENIVNYCRDKNDKIKIYLYDFVIISSKQNNITKKIRIEAATFILSNYCDIVKDNNNQELHTFILNIIDFINYESMFTDDDYTQIIDSIKFDTFDDVKFFLLNKTKQYNRCLNLLLEPKSKIHDKINTLFSWIEETHQKLLKNESGLKKFKLDLMENLKKIADIEIDKFNLMVKDIFSDKKKDVLNKLLSQDKQTCLNYIEVLINAINSTSEEDDNDNKINNDGENISYTLKLHVQLLCELNKQDEILLALEKNHLYPYEECLKLCRQYKVYDSIIYLNQINGDYAKGVEVCLERMDEYFKNILTDVGDNKIEKIEVLNEKYIDSFTKYLNKGIIVCENSQGNDEDIWFNILNKLFEYENKIPEYVTKYNDNELNKSLIQHFQNVILQDIKDLMENMCSYVSITKIMNVVSERNKDAGFKEFKELIMKILNNYSSQTNIFVSTRNLLSNLIFENEGLFQRLNQEGDLLDFQKCDGCKKEFNKDFMSKENVILFNCKHMYHKNCVAKENTDNGIEEVCPICSAIEFEQTQKKGQSLIIRQNTRLDKDKYENKEFQVKVSSNGQNIFKKLKRFDNKLKVKKRISIENTLTLQQGS